MGYVRGNPGEHRGNRAPSLQGIAGDSLGDSLGIHWGIRGVRGKSETLSDKFSFHFISLHFISCLSVCAQRLLHLSWTLHCWNCRSTTRARRLWRRHSWLSLQQLHSWPCLLHTHWQTRCLSRSLWRHLFFCSQWPLSLRTPRTQNSSTKRVS